MIIKSEFIGDHSVICIPDNMPWEIFVRSVGSDGYEDNGLYLRLDGEEHSLSDADEWCYGRPLPGYAIAEFHNDVIDTICTRMADDPNLRLIDIQEIISWLLTSKYEKEWADKGYIRFRKDGSW